MRKNRGFRLGRKLSKVFKIKCVINRRTTEKFMTRICNCGRSLKQRAKELWFTKQKLGYLRVGPDPVETKPLNVPKGHLAVYVGDKEDETCRYLVPVIYFNHPLFANLLRETEKQFGYNQPAGIQIPCPASEFEKVRTRISATDDCRERRSRGLRCLSSRIRGLLS